MSYQALPGRDGSIPIKEAFDPEASEIGVDVRECFPKVDEDCVHQDTSMKDQ
jgi:hypothetical protein